MTATGTIVVRTSADGTVVVGVRTEGGIVWFPAATSHIVNAMKGHPGVACVVTYTEDGDPVVKNPTMVTVG